MIDTKKDKPEIPDWVFQDNNETETTEPFDIAPYEHMRRDFLAACREGAMKLRRQKRTRQGIEAIFSKAGQLLEAATSLVSPIEPQAAMFRGAPETAKSTVRQTLSHISRNVAGATIHVVFVRTDNQVWLEVNLADADSGVDIRPFRIAVQDGEGQKIFAASEVPPGTLPPRYPSPQAGEYRFVLEWDQGQGGITIAVEEEEEDQL